MEGILSQQELKETLLTCAADDDVVVAAAAAAGGGGGAGAFVSPNHLLVMVFLPCPAWLNLNSMIYDLRLHLISTKNRNGINPLNFSRSLLNHLEESVDVFGKKRVLIEILAPYA
ncbi:Hypothetical predicted protein [Octopus vulgaris]|uniref:Uncharacterized protein n=1 Tax=Octopus vulgaris TaxID=6645 RepID=A0AA36AZH5_OCTVU|nr:Hypothetical predicted protein [Octopus vulgaris]